MEKSGFLEQNVEESNKLVAKIMAFTIVLLIGAWILNFTNVFAIKDSIMTISCIAGVLILLVPLLAIYVLKIGNSTVKYINIICAALFVSILSTTLSFHVAILYLYPIIIGSIYFTKKVNYLTAAFTVVGTTAAQFISYQIEPEFDENITSMSEMVTYSLIPRMICFICVFCVFCILNNRISKLLGNVLGAEEQEKVYNKMKRMTDKSSEASKTLVESAEKLSTVADENLLKIADITDNTEAVVSSSMETLNELNKVEANINTIAESISELAEHSQQVQNLSDDVTNITKENSAVMEQAIKSMNQISDSTKNSKKIIQELEDKSNEINGIVDTITGISSQTNLLALNAAIEAARAGDQGKGFAVVAEEIRKLAEQTQAAVLSIGNIISTIIAQTGEAAAAMDSNVILTQEGTGIISKADSSSNDMSTAGNSMHEKILEMNVVTKQVAEKSNEIKEIIVNLSESSRKNTEGLNKVSEANASSYDNMKELEEMVKNINSISEEINEIVASV